MMFLSTVLCAVAFARFSAGASVIAHFMVQNSYAYTIDQWKDDMNTAKDIGIDGFALNWVPPDCQPGLSWTVDRIDDAFTAAEQVDFKLVHSFDMSYTECDVYWNQTFMADMISKHAGSSATYRWNSNILVTTYGGDMVQQYGNAFFQGLKDKMKGSNAITLSPALTKYSMSAQTNTDAAKQLLSDFPSIDGYFNWQAWPLNTKENVTAAPDQAFQSALKTSGKTGPYIMAVSPWQYKDLNNGNPLDAWVAYSDTLFPDRFESLTSDDTINPDIIELLTWNDFCESHYLRDLPSTSITAHDFVTLGDMASYVFGQDHSGWRFIAQYYINYWKSGKPPAVEKDHVIYWYRVHPKDAICLGGSHIRNHDLPEDAVFAWALVSKPATISLSMGSNKYYEFEADAGTPVMGSVPFPDNLGLFGATPEVAIVRDNQNVHWGQGSKAVTAACAWQNYNPNVNVVGDSLSSGL